MLFQRFWHLITVQEIAMHCAKTLNPLILSYLVIKCFCVCKLSVQILYNICDRGEKLEHRTRQDSFFWIIFKGKMVMMGGTGQEGGGVDAIELDKQMQFSHWVVFWSLNEILGQKIFMTLWVRVRIPAPAHRVFLFTRCSTIQVNSVTLIVYICLWITFKNSVVLKGKYFTEITPL